MKLTIAERLIFYTLYPQKSTYFNQLLVQEIKGKVDITVQEIEEFNIQEMISEGRVVGYNYDKEKDEGLEIDFARTEIEFLRNQVNKLDENKEVTYSMISLIEKIKA